MTHQRSMEPLTSLYALSTAYFHLPRPTSRLYVSKLLSSSCPTSLTSSRYVAKLAVRVTAGTALGQACVCWANETMDWLDELERILRPRSSSGGVSGAAAGSGEAYCSFFAMRSSREKVGCCQSFDEAEKGSMRVVGATMVIVVLTSGYTRGDGERVVVSGRDGDRFTQHDFASFSYQVGLSWIELN